MSTASRIGVRAILSLWSVSHIRCLLDFVCHRIMAYGCRGIKLSIVDHPWSILQILYLGSRAGRDDDL